jgi:hypothetical protein
MASQPPFNPPHVVHAHPQHPELPPPPKHYIHPSVLERERAEQERLERAAGTYPGLNLLLFFFGIFGGTVGALWAFRPIGLYVLIPPAIALFLGAMGLTYVIEMAFAALLLAIVKKVVSGEKKYEFEQWSIKGPSGSVGFGTFIGVLVAIGIRAFT